MGDISVLIAIIMTKFKLTSEDLIEIHEEAKPFRIKKRREFETKIKRGECLTDIERTIIKCWVTRYGKK